MKKSSIFSIDIYEDLTYKGRRALAESTKNPEILTILAEDHDQYVRGHVVQNVNTPIYILVKMLEEYDEVSWSLKTEDHYSGYRKERIEKTLSLIKKELGGEFETVKKISEVLYSKKHFI
jgi:hypothetical protein